jgi:hypothetical protein
MKGLLIAFCFTCLCLPGTLSGGDCPIIFVHGIQIDSPTAESGLNTWNPDEGFPTPMTRIINSHYKGYQKGIPLDCHEDTTLQYMPDTKRIYNFSYYHVDGSEGVIGDNTIFECMYGIDRRDGTIVEKGSIPPQYFRDIYAEAAAGGSWAQNLTDFIEKVLDHCYYGTNDWHDNPSAKVDIVVHSMGGLVIRFAMKYCELSNGELVKDRVRKLIMVGTPNHPYTCYASELIYIKFKCSRLWQGCGELWEMGVDKEANITFENLATQEEGLWCNLLGYNGYGVDIASIAGNRKPFELLGEPVGPDDGIVNVEQAYISGAQFNPVIYASHCHLDPGWLEQYACIGAEEEVALTECTYTTEFIKKWIIDDEVLIETSSISEHFTYPNEYKKFELRVGVGIDHYQDILTTQIHKYDVIGSLLDVRAFPLHVFSKGAPGDPIYSIDPNELIGTYGMYFRSYDMEGLVGDDTWTMVGRAGDPASVTLITPNGGENFASHSFHQIKWSNDFYFYALFHRLYYKVGNGDWIYIDQVNGSGTSCLWQIPILTETSNTCKIRIRTYLDKFTHISDISDNNFTITVPSWQPYDLQCLDQGEDYIHISWANYYQDYDSIQIWRRPSQRDTSTWGRIDVVSGSSIDYLNSGLTRGVLYKYKLKAWIGVWPSPFSDVLQITTPWLSTPTEFEALPESYDLIRLEWLDRSQYNTGYQTQYKIGANGTWENTDDQPVGDIDYLDVDGLSPNTSYHFRVRAYDNSNHYSNWSEVGPVKMGGIRNLAAIPANESITLQWKTPAPNTVTFATKILIVRANGTQVQFDPEDGVFYYEGNPAGNGVVVYVGDNNQNEPYDNIYIDDDLQNGQTYTYKCFAFSEFDYDPNDPYYTEGVEESAVPANYVGFDMDVITIGNNSPKIAVTKVTGEPGREIISIVYGEKIGPANYNVLSDYSTNGGESWDSLSLVWPSASNYPCIAVRDSITEEEYTTPPMFFSYKYLVFGTLTAANWWNVVQTHFDEYFLFWTYPEVLSNRHYCSWPSMVIDNDTAYVAWTSFADGNNDFKVTFRYFDIDDLILSEKENIPGISGAYEKVYPSIAVSRVNEEANQHIVYQWGSGEVGGYPVLGKIAHSYRYEENGIWQWSESEQLQLGAHPSLVAGSDNNLYLVYTTRENFENSGMDQIAFRHYDGITWSDIEIVADLPTSGPGLARYYPGVLYDNGNCYVVWEEPTANYGYQIFYRERNSDGEWSNKINLSGQMEGCIWPSMAFSSDFSKIYVIWSQQYEGVVFWSIELLPSISIISPSQGNVWHCGEEVDIVWEAQDNTDGLAIQSIEYSTNGGTEWTLIASEEENDGIYQWTVSNTPSENCRVRITVRDHAGNEECAVSGVFTISDDMPPEVTLMCPNGYEVWNIGDTEVIRWLATDNVGIDTQHIYYSADAGVSWTEIELMDPIIQVDSVYIYYWDIPTIFSHTCKIKVVALDNNENSGEDISDNNFSIGDYEPPVVTITAPNGGENFEIGSTYSVEWNASDNVVITDNYPYYSTNFGVSWIEIPMEHPRTDRDQSYICSWEIPATPSANCELKVESYDGAGNVGTGYSDDLFKISYFVTRNTDATGYSPKLYKSNDKLHLVFTSGDTVYYSQSPDDGISFAQKYCVGIGGYPTVLCNDDHTYVLWTKDNKLYYRYHHGIRWDSEVTLATVTAGTELRQVFGVIDNYGNIQMAFEGKYEYTREVEKYTVYHGTMIMNNPGSFLYEEVTQATSLDESANIAFSLDSYDHAYIAFSHNGEIWSFTNENGNWQSDIMVGSGRNPRIDVYDGFLHYVWDDSGVIKHRERILGAEWLSEETVSAETGKEFKHPVMESGCVVFFVEEPDPNPDDSSCIVYKIRNMSGWQEKIHLTDQAKAGYPQILIEKQRDISVLVYTLYTEGTFTPLSVDFNKTEITIPHQATDMNTATAHNNQRKVVNNGLTYAAYSSQNKVFLTYALDEKNLGERWIIGDGVFPALACYTDNSSNDILAAVWVNAYSLDWALSVDTAEWSTPFHIVSNIGVPTHYSPPSLVIDDAGMGHLAWEIITEPYVYPGYITYRLHYSRFNAGVEQPEIIEDAILDEATEYVDGWVSGLELECASIALGDRDNPVVVWSRPLGEGKDVVYCKQKIETWSAEPEVVSNPATESKHPFCDICNDKIHVCWEADGLIKYRERAANSGTPWQSIETVSNQYNVSRSAQVYDGDVCIYTEVPQFQQGEASHVVHAERMGPGNWSASTIIDSTSDLSEYPQSYLISSPVERRLHTIWTEGNEDPYEVRYKETVISSGDVSGERVCGHISTNTVWDTDKYITGDVVVDQGKTLTIVPGVQVVCAAVQDAGNLGVDPKRCELIVEGRLVIGENGAERCATGMRRAISGENDQSSARTSVVFTSGADKPRPGDWYGIVLKNQAGHALHDCRIEYAEYGITTQNSSLALQDIHIEACEKAGVLSEVTAEQATEDLQNDNAVTAPVSRSVHKQMAIGELSDRTQTVDEDACDIKTEREKQSIQLAIDRCVFSKNGIGVWCQGQQEVRITNSVITSNTQEGIVLEDGAVVMESRDNEVHSNGEEIPGQAGASGPLGNETGGVYTNQLYAAMPNPFTRATKISYSIARPGQVRLCLYDVSGRLVRTLEDGYKPAGAYSLVWDGCDNVHRTLARGVYFVQLVAEEFTAVEKVIMVK